MFQRVLNLASTPEVDGTDVPKHVEVMKEHTDVFVVFAVV